MALFRFVLTSTLRAAPRIFTGAVIVAAAAGCASSGTGSDTHETSATRGSSTQPTPGKSQAWQQGERAVQRQDWAAAVRYFSDAQKSTPWDPSTLFNLGLAHDKAGHEILAMAWLHAYLAADPTSSDSAAVRAALPRLEQQVNQHFEQFVSTALGLANKLPEKFSQQSEKERIADTMASAGFPDRGYAVAASAGSDASLDHYLSWYALFGLGRVGDAVGLSRLSKEHPKVDLEGGMYQLVLYYFDNGNFEEAMPLARRLLQESSKNPSLYATDRTRLREQMVTQDLQNGNFDSANAALASLTDRDADDLLLKMIDRRLEESNVREALRLVADLHAKGWRQSALANVAHKQFESRDTNGAEQTARQILQNASNNNSDSESAIALAHAVLGHYDQAIQVVEAHYKDPHLQWEAKDSVDWDFGYITFVQVMFGDEAGAKRTAARAAHEPQAFFWTSPFDSKPQRAVAKQLGNAQRGMAEAYSIKGEWDKALASAAEVREDRRTALVMDIVDKLVARGDLRRAEVAARLLAPGVATCTEYCAGLMRVQYSKCLYKIAGGYAKINDRAGALRRLDSARDSLMDFKAYSAGWDSKDAIPMAINNLKQVAGLEAKLGDDAGASATRRFIPSDATVQWVNLAIKFSHDTRITDLRAGLDDALKIEAQYANQIPGRVAEVAEWSLGDPLLQIRAMDRRLNAATLAGK